MSGSLCPLSSAKLGVRSKAKNQRVTESHGLIYWVRFTPDTTGGVMPAARHRSLAMTRKRLRMLMLTTSAQPSTCLLSGRTCRPNLGDDKFMESMGEKIAPQTVG